MRELEDRRIGTRMPVRMTEYPLCAYRHMSLTSETNLGTQVATLRFKLLSWPCAAAVVEHCTGRKGG